MKYLLLHCVDGPMDAKPEEFDPGEWVREMHERRVRVVGERLEPTEEAATVRVRDGERLVTAGPHVQTREWIAGFDLIECADLDEAVEIAGKHPMAKIGMVEVRPVWMLE
ncbi:YciI family protein [Spongiactinospora sp. TRM90649]|uniref:YciI family protein n=1 Tax=Spongiactinospora sp. TRM90649 TaxID=3031114 RepID=UPI0023F72CF0|nr:YciI family protein [Spongiactinospora sp. TRM90649]MDF5758057.1 YciI family protein [Spongiactinospora sp. TRM90649]